MERTAPPWEDHRIMDLLADPRIWTMGMKLASIPIAVITTDALGEVITDGPVPTPTDRFVQMAGFDWVRSGGAITAEIDARAVATAVLTVRVLPIDELLKLAPSMEAMREMYSGAPIEGGLPVPERAAKGGDTQRNSSPTTE